MFLGEIDLGVIVFSFVKFYIVSLIEVKFFIILLVEISVFVLLSFYIISLRKFFGSYYYFMYVLYLKYVK